MAIGACDAVLDKHTTRYSNGSASARKQSAPMTIVPAHRRRGPSARTRRLENISGSVEPVAAPEATTCRGPLWGVSPAFQRTVTVSFRGSARTAPVRCSCMIRDIAPSCWVGFDLAQQRHTSSGTRHCPQRFHEADTLGHLIPHLKASRFRHDHRSRPLGLTAAAPETRGANASRVRPGPGTARRFRRS